MSEVEARRLDNSVSLSERYRLALRGVGSTVTVITTADGEDRHSMVATATMSVSLDPAVIVIAVNQSASIHAPLTRRGAFCVNVLSAEHAELGSAIATAAQHDRFSVGDWQSADGPDASIRALPYLEDAQSVVLCKVTERVAHGTHTLFIGEVRDVLLGETREPLLYVDGRYGRFVRI